MRACSFVSRKNVYRRRGLGWNIQINEKPCSISDCYELGTTCTAGVGQCKKYFDTCQKNLSVDLYLFIVKFSTKSSVFLHTAHVIHIAVPSFNLALCKARSSSFANIMLHHGCVSRHFPKYSEWLLRRIPLNSSFFKL